MKYMYTILAAGILSISSAYAQTAPSPATQDAAMQKMRAQTANIQAQRASMQSKMYQIIIKRQH